MAILATATAPGAIRDFLLSARADVDEALARRLESSGELPADDPQEVLADAMRYAVLGGGKRLRPAIVLAVSRAISGSDSAADRDAMAAACAVELLHAYTLVHDDLPAMDDDDVRRGRPTVHKKYGQAIAILAGDALLTLAFACLADLGPRCATAVSALSRASGHRQLLAGQALDLALDQAASPSLADVERIHLGKTGALFGAAAELGAIAAAASADETRSMRLYGTALGVAFQHADDLDDGELPGLATEAARRRSELAAEAIETLRGLGDRGRFLAELVRWVGGISGA